MAMDSVVKNVAGAAKRQEERRALRALILDCGLKEQVKWGKLCYAHDGANVVIIYGMKNYCAIGFSRGAP